MLGEAVCNVVTGLEGWGFETSGFKGTPEPLKPPAAGPAIKLQHGGYKHAAPFLVQKALCTGRCDEASERRRCPYMYVYIYIYIDICMYLPI